MVPFRPVAHVQLFFSPFNKEQCDKDMNIFSKICAAIHLFTHTLFLRLVTVKSRTRDSKRKGCCTFLMTSERTACKC